MNQPKLHYQVHGSQGPYLLLVHGMLSSRAQWMANMAAFTAYSRPVVVELFGHGRAPSPEDPATYSPQAYVAAIEEMREELGVERWLVCGQSLGAALTLRYVLDRPERAIAHVFTNSMSALAPDGWAEYVRPLMQRQAEALERDGIAAIENHPLHPGKGSRLQAEVRDALVADCRLHNPHGIALTGLHTVPDSSVRERIGENSVPTLLVAGEREKRFRDHRLFAEEHMPHLQVTCMDAGHSVNAEVVGEFDCVVAAFYKPLI